MNRWTNEQTLAKFNIDYPFFNNHNKLSNQLVDIFDGYSGTLPLLVIALCEVLVAAWVYGTNKMEDDILFCCEFKSKLQPYWNICWKFISPAMLFVIIAMSVWDLKNGVSVPLWVDKANNDTGVYQAAGMTTTPGTVSKSVNRPDS